MVSGFRILAETVVDNLQLVPGFRWCMGHVSVHVILISPLELSVGAVMILDARMTWTNTSGVS